MSQTRFLELESLIKSRANRPQAAILQRFFKTGSGEYGEGDVFLGLKVPLQRQIARQYKDLPQHDIQRLLNSKIHEFRLIALLILVEKYEKAEFIKDKQKIVNFYLKNTSRINNWDLVDLSVYKIIGDFALLTERADILDTLANSHKLWERRMAVVGTYAFIKAGRTAEIRRIAKKLLFDHHDLIQKAVGWMLREMGKRVSVAELHKFLEANYLRMPRTSLRYAIERLSPPEREHYLTK